MISVQDAITQFKALVAASASWARLAKSQFVEHLAIFNGLAMRDAQWKIERATQEFFLSTALNDASVRAHAEDREYVPRKAVASVGPVRITNNGTAAVVLPPRTALISDQQVDYLLEASIGIAAGDYIDAAVSQLVYAAPIVVSVNAEQPFFEVLFPRDTIGRVASFRVTVDQGTGAEEWAFARLFHNCLPTAQAYDEFYSHTGQHGVRFGNGKFGMMPPANSIVTVEYWTTDGATTLLSGQNLHPAGDLLDITGASADLTIVATDSIDGGGPAESITEMRPNLHYWAQYGEKVVWDDDYAFYIRQRVYGITWIKCWGEEDQEAESGFDVQNINKIFVCAHAPGNAEIAAEVTAVLADIPLLNRKFQWVDPVLSTFTVQLTGTVSRSVTVATAIADIKAALAAAYGVDATGRKVEPSMDDLYAIVKDTGHFVGGRYQITLAGKTAATQLAEILSVDVVNSTFNLTYA